jgi:hypothetical protein
MWRCDRQTNLVDSHRPERQGAKCGVDTTTVLAGVRPADITIRSRRGASPVHGTGNGPGAPQFAPHASSCDRGDPEPPFSAWEMPHPTQATGRCSVLTCGVTGSTAVEGRLRARPACCPIAQGAYALRGPSRLPLTSPGPAVPSGDALMTSYRAAPVCEVLPLRTARRRG